MSQKNSEQNNKSYLLEVLNTGTLSIREFSKASSEPLFEEFFEMHLLKPENRTINLLPIKDMHLRSRIIEYLYSCMNPDISMPEYFKESKYLTLKHMLTYLPELFSVSYDEFMKIGESAFNSMPIRNYESKLFYRLFISYSKNKDEGNNSFEEDIWDFERFNLSNDRNDARHFRKISFRKIRNARNKFLVKKHIEYCLMNTDIAATTIRGKISTFNVILNFIDKPFDEWNEKDTDDCILETKAFYNGNSRTIASRMITMNIFAEYLLIHDYIKKNPLLKY